MLTVQQGTDPLHFTYHLDDGSNLVALALGANGCPGEVLISMNRDPEDSAFDDKDVTDVEQDAKIRDTYRAGEGHFIGVLNVIESGSTNTWLVPLGHMTFRRQLEQAPLT